MADVTETSETCTALDEVLAPTSRGTVSQDEIVVGDGVALEILAAEEDSVGLVALARIEEEDRRLGPPDLEALGGIVDVIEI